MDERELIDVVDELTETLESLREELITPRRGPFGLPRPPNPTELLRVTEQYTLPAIIALLESSIRILELLAATIRLLDESRFDESGRQPPAKLSAVNRRTLRALDNALSDLQYAVEGGESNIPEVQALLDEARMLRAEVQKRVGEAGDKSERNRKNTTTDAAKSDPVGISVREDRGDEPVEINIEKELETIKDEIDTESNDREETDEEDDEDPDISNGD